MFGLDKIDPEKLPQIAAALSREGKRQMKLYTAKVRKQAAKEMIQLFTESGASSKVIKKVEKILSQKNETVEPEKDGLKIIVT